MVLCNTCDKELKDCVCNDRSRSRERREREAKAAKEKGDLTLDAISRLLDAKLAPVNTNIDSLKTDVKGLADKVDATAKIAQQAKVAAEKAKQDVAEVKGDVKEAKTQANKAAETAEIAKQAVKSLEERTLKKEEVKAYVEDMIAKAKKDPVVDEENREREVVVTGWVAERDEKDIQKKINDMIDENGWRARVKDVFCHGDPANFGIIEFHTPASAKSFLRRLAKMTSLEIEAGKVMKFSANRTLLQRAGDKRLGMIKHLLAQLEGIDLKDVKISWKANVVRLKSEIVYKRTSSGEHEYIGKASEIKVAVEEQIKNWLEERGVDESM